MIDTNSYRRAEDIRFFKAAQTAIANEAWWRRIAQIKKSTQKSEDYGWLGDLPGVKEWLDERVIEALKKFTYSLENKDWEDTIGIDTNDIADNPNFVEDRIPMLADVMARHPNKLMTELMEDGTTNLCYDGTAFYNTIHPINGDTGNTFTNLVTGSGITVANIKTDLGTVKENFLTYKDANGDVKFDSIGKILVQYHPNLEEQMTEIFEAERAASGATNTFYKKMEPHALGRFSDTIDWYAHKVDGLMLPFVFQERKAITREWDLTEKFMRRHIFFGVDARYVGGYALPEFSQKVNNT